MNNLNNKKLKAVLSTMLLLLTAYVFIETDMSSASPDNSGDLPDFLNGAPNIDYDFLWTKTRELGRIVNDSNSDNRGREFGTWGEQNASERILKYMTDIIGITAQRETINSEWTWSDSWDGPLDNTDHYIGVLNQKRTFAHSDYFLNVTLWKKVGNNWEYDDHKNLTCFPLLKGGLNHNKSFESIKITEAGSHSVLNHLILVDQNWKKPYGFYNDLFYGIFRLCVRGFIVVSYDPESFFMSPSYDDHFFSPNPEVASMAGQVLSLFT